MDPWTVLSETWATAGSTGRYHEWDWSPSSSSKHGQRPKTYQVIDLNASIDNYRWWTLSSDIAQGTGPHTVSPIHLSWLRKCGSQFTVWNVCIYVNLCGRCHTPNEVVGTTAKYVIMCNWQKDHNHRRSLWQSRNLADLPRYLLMLLVQQNSFFSEPHSLYLGCLCLILFISSWLMIKSKDTEKIHGVSRKRTLPSWITENFPLLFALVICRVLSSS